MKIVFDEWYGEVSVAQRAAYKKYNVSPADHDELARYYGEDAHQHITDAVKRHSSTGMYSAYSWQRNG